MAESFYTVEQISKMLNIHPKTLQRYIREGRLGAVKIGKSWRVSGHDLSVFTEREKKGDPGENGRSAKREGITVSAVVDMAVAGTDEAMRIASALTAALNSKPPEYGRSTMHILHIPEDGILRVTLWGGIRFTEVMMGALSALTGEEE